MSSGRSRLYDDAEVALRGDVGARAVSKRETALESREMRREIDTLRSINAHLVRQIAVLKQREAHAQRLADRDGLTGLYNRRRMLELLDASIDDAARHDQRVGLLFVDLDGFKAVNDAHGHAAGDKLLMTVASRIAARARTADFVCRYGGDEFVVILPRVMDMAAVCRVADSIRSRVALPYRIDGLEVNMTAAIGVSLYPDQAQSAAELMNRADESMYRVKALAGDAQYGDVPPSPAAPARRRDDASRRRPV
jgi:diguanylate cyclase (GGDEF)-like protein